MEVRGKKSRISFGTNPTISFPLCALEVLRGRFSHLPTRTKHSKNPQSIQQHRLSRLPDRLVSHPSKPHNSKPSLAEGFPPVVSRCSGRCSHQSKLTPTSPPRARAKRGRRSRGPGRGEALGAVLEMRQDRGLPEGAVRHEDHPRQLGLRDLNDDVHRVWKGLGRVGGVFGGGGGFAGCLGFFWGGWESRKHREIRFLNRRAETRPKCQRL